MSRVKLINNKVIFLNKDNLDCTLHDKQTEEMKKKKIDVYDYISETKLQTKLKKVYSRKIHLNKDYKLVNQLLTENIKLKIKD